MTEITNESFTDDEAELEALKILVHEVITLLVTTKALDACALLGRLEAIEATAKQGDPRVMEALTIHADVIRDFFCPRDD